MDIHLELKELSKFLSDYSTSLMAVGVHTSRIVRNTARIAESFGFFVDMTIFQKTIIMTLRDKDNTHSYSTVNKIKPMALNFEINSRLSSLSWEAYDEHLTLDELRTKYQEIVSNPRMSKWMVLFLVSCANASFCRLFTGDWQAMGIVFVATLVGFFVRQKMMEKHLNHLFVFVVSSFVASMIGCTAVIYNIGTTPQIALGTSILYLVPGVPLINGIIDIIEGHVLAGVSRLINAALLIICLSIGLSLTLLLLGVQTL
ncbi:threonine/serine exporter family protein [uncultured Bacteroides sp.]|uniref:threonine/serine ThrE exporter family protein n=1 Tax=uncultured Bacteroides sp. TaxID=162156 RepID=UPI002AA6C0D8|nr:threonine/serine exporter family protein [uncultured Bacteroides sp.]